ATAPPAGSIRHPSRRMVTRLVSERLPSLPRCPPGGAIGCPSWTLAGGSSQGAGEDGGAAAGRILAALCDVLAGLDLARGPRSCHLSGPSVRILLPAATRFWAPLEGSWRDRPRR